MYTFLQEQGILYAPVKLSEDLFLCYLNTVLINFARIIVGTQSLKY